jgi:DsbC/DsbD-like thiol-disulfide interchange protein
MHVLIVAVLLSLVSVQRPADVVKWSATAPGTAVTSGGEAKITLTAKIESGWKLYALTQPAGGPVPLTIASPKGAALTVVRKRISAGLPKSHKDENFKVDTLFYEDDARFTVPVTVPKTAAAGRTAVPIDVTFQACGESICLRPFTERVTVNITIVR